MIPLFDPTNSIEATTRTTPEVSPCVLVVDDEPEVRSLLRRILDSLGYTVLEAGDGSDALQVLEQRNGVPAEAIPHPVDIIVTDIQMPRMRGDILLQRVREQYPDIAVILITAISDVEMAISCMRAGASDYILKPFSIADVAVRVRRALEHRALQIANREFQRQKQHLDHLRPLVLNLVEALQNASQPGVSDAAHLRDACRLASLLQVELFPDETPFPDLPLDSDEHS